MIFSTPLRGCKDAPPSRKTRTGLRAALIAAVTAAAVLVPVSANAAATDPPGSYSAQNIASDRTSNNYFYRIPALAHLGDGVLLAAWDGRPGSAADAPNPNSVVFRRSIDNGATWSDIGYIAEGKTGSGQYGYSDPSFVVDKQTGAVFMFSVYSQDQGFHGSVYGNDDSNRNIISAAVVRSDDGGLTWGEPRLITDVAKTAEGTTVNGVYQPVTGDVKGMFATSGEGIQLQYGEYAGRLVQQFAATVRQANGGTAIQAYSVYSDDNGATWQRGAYVGTGMDENKTVELSDGTVMLNSRDSDNGRLRKVAYSTDGGATYGAVTRDTELPDPTNNASITRLVPDAAEGSSDAKKLLFTNSNNGADGSRVNGAARISCDDGATWPGIRSIETGSFGYSTAAALANGRFGVLWERNYTSDMQFSSFDEAWLNYTCAPLEVATTAATAGVATPVSVKITNQEDEALSGSVTLAVPSGWKVTPAQVTNLAPGASTTVSVSVTPSSTAAGDTKLQTVFTATDGRQSQFTATLQLPRESVLGANLSITNTTAARNLTTNPFVAGDVLSFTIRVESTYNTATFVTPGETNFTSGFAPTACRYQNLPAYGGYNCTTPRVTLTQADIDRGTFTPNFAVNVAVQSNQATTAPAKVTGSAIALRDGVVSATITGARNDAGRDLAARPYAAGDAVPYSFRVDNTSPMTIAVVPTAGSFAPFLPPGAGNCRYSSLTVGAGYSCTTPAHTVTADEAAQGFFTADSTWQLSASGQSTKTVTVASGEVDVLARAPKLAAVVTGTFNDVNGDGFRSVGDTVTFARTVTNTGNVRLDGVVAGADLGSVAVGASTSADAVLVTLTDEHVASGVVAAPSFTATATNGSRAVEASSTGSDVMLPAAAPSAPAYVNTQVYVAGDRVSFDGSIWEATWWTRGATPGSVTGSWQQIVENADGQTIWTPSRIFTKGDTVVHEGKTYVAQWWTRGEKPAASAWGPWKLG